MLYVKSVDLWVAEIVTSLYNEPYGKTKVTVQYSVQSSAMQRAVHIPFEDLGTENPKNSSSHVGYEHHTHATLLGLLGAYGLIPSEPAGSTSN